MAAKRRARQLAVLLAVAALLVTASGPAAGTAGAQAPGAARLARSGQERGVAVTLLTGDKVLLRQRPGGRTSVQVVAAPRRGGRPSSVAERRFDRPPARPSGGEQRAFPVR